MSSCPTLAELLCALEEERSSSTRDDEAKRHVASCRTCRANLRSFEALVAAGRLHVLKDVREDDVSRVARFRRRLQDERRADAVTGFGTRWWWVAAVVLPLYVVSLGLARLPEVRVTPEHLLSEAARIEGTEPEEVGRRVRFELKPDRRTGRQAGLWMVRDIAGDGWPGREQAAELTPVVEALRRQQAAGSPLSATAFAVWRKTAQNRRDRVTVTADLWILRSEGGAGDPIRSAELMVNRTSYRVVGQAWVVDRLGRLEIAELARWTRGHARADAVVPGPPGAATSVVASDWLEAAELRARSLLHDLELDDAARVTRRDERVLVAASIDSYEQRRALTSALRRLPAVSSDVRAGAPPRPPVSSSPDLRAWVRRRFDAESPREGFAPRLRSLAQSVRRRAIALDLLAQRYPPATDKGLSPGLQAQVARLADRHVEALQRDLMGLDAHFMALTGITKRCALASLAPRDWRARAIAARPQAEVAVGEIEALLTMDDLPDDARWKPRTGEAFAGVWNAWCHARAVVGNVAKPR